MKTCLSRLLQFLKNNELCEGGSIGNRIGILIDSLQFTKLNEPAFVPARQRPNKGLPITGTVFLVRCELKFLLFIWQLL